MSSLATHVDITISSHLTELVSLPTPLGGQLPSPIGRPTPLSEHNPNNNQLYFDADIGVTEPRRQCLRRSPQHPPTNHPPRHQSVLRRCRRLIVPSMSATYSTSLCLQGKHKFSMSSRGVARSPRRRTVYGIRRVSRY